MVRPCSENPSRGLNRMSMKDAKASNWVAENATPTLSGFNLRGSSKGYTTFAMAFSATQDVFYSAHDDSGNREAGYAQFDGTNLVMRMPTATLVNGVYESKSPSKVNFIGDVVVACTFNAVAFNTLWSAFDQIDPDGDGNINIPPELIGGLGDALRKKADQVDLEKEIADRIAGDADLQDQIDNIDVGAGGGVSSWNDLTDKPSEFPPEPHTHSTTDVDGLDEQLKEIDETLEALQGQLALGASYDASTGLVVHAHKSGFEDGQPLPPYQDHEDTFVIVSVAGDNPVELFEGDWLVAGPLGWVPVKYGSSGVIDWNNIINAPDFVEDAPSDGEQYARKDGSWSVVESTGAGFVISDTEPDEDDRFEGLQWLDTVSATVWVWDGSQWLEFPAGGAAYDDAEIRALIDTNSGYIQTNISNISINKAEIATKLDADTIWTGTQDEYDLLSPDADTLYFIV